MRTKTSSSGFRLGNYLTAGIGVGCLAGTADAAIVTIDIGPTGLNIAGPNAGLTNSYGTFDFAGVTDGLEIYHATFGYWGLDGDSGLSFATTGGDASIRNFSSGDLIDSTLNFTGAASDTAFKYQSYPEAADFGPGSYVGFRANDNYGWLEVTWDSSTDTFEILSGAYEDSGAPILAGQTGISAVPEINPTSIALLVMGSAGLLSRRRRAAALRTAAVA